MQGRMLVAAAMAFGVVTVGITACTEAPPEPLASDATPTLQAADGDYDMEVIQSVSGNGHNLESTVRRAVTFNVVKYVDGTVEGWYHVRARGGGAHVRVRIDCLHVVGNQAWFSGIIVAAANPDNIGLPYALRVVDNGEGMDDPPDQFGVGRFVADACTTEPDLALRDLTIGNIVVRD